MYFNIIVKKMSFLKKVFKFQRKFFVKHNCYLLKEKSKLSNRFFKQ